MFHPSRARSVKLDKQVHVLVFAMVGMQHLLPPSFLLLFTMVILLLGGLTYAHMSSD